MLLIGLLCVLGTVARIWLKTVYFNMCVALLIKHKEAESGEETSQNVIKLLQSWDI